MSVDQPELDQPGRNCRLGDLGKGIFCRIYLTVCKNRLGQRNSRREPEDGMVPDIEDIHAELELVALLNTETLLHREVPILLEWPAERIPWSIAISGCARSSEVRHVVGLLCACGPAGNVQVVRENGGTGARCVSRLRIRTDEYSRARSSAKSAAPGISNGKWQPALIRDDPADGPAFEELIVHETVLHYRQVIGVAHHESMWPIKVTS